MAAVFCTLEAGTLAPSTRVLSPAVRTMATTAMTATAPMSSPWDTALALSTWEEGMETIVVPLWEGCTILTREGINDRCSFQRVGVGKGRGLSSFEMVIMVMVVVMMIFFFFLYSWSRSFFVIPSATRLLLRTSMFFEIYGLHCRRRKAQ